MHKQAKHSAHLNQENTKRELRNQSKLFLRNIYKINGESILVVGHLKDNFGICLKDHLSKSLITFFNIDYAAHRCLVQDFIKAGHSTDRLIYDSWYKQNGELHDTVLIFLPKSRDLIEMVFTMVTAAIKKDAKVFLVGENSAGIRSIRHALETIIGEIIDSDAARHCVLYTARRIALPNQLCQLKDWVKYFQINLRQMRFEIKSLPGVFSHGRLDAGTHFFLENLELPASGRVLDFGCGVGIIGLTVKRLWPESEVDLVDSSALSLESSRLTMLANNLPFLSIFPSDIFSDVRKTYDRILSNPPFHEGVKTDYRVVEGFFSGAANHLAKNGTLIIVANRFLKYRPLIEKYIGPCRIIAENKGYRVYEGTKS